MDGAVVAGTRSPNHPAVAQLGRQAGGRAGAGGGEATEHILSAEGEESRGTSPTRLERRMTRQAKYRVIACSPITLFQHGTEAVTSEMMVNEERERLFQRHLHESKYVLGVQASARYSYRSGCHLVFNLSCEHPWTSLHTDPSTGTVCYTMPLVV